MKEVPYNYVTQREHIYWSLRLGESRDGTRCVGVSFYYLPSSSLLVDGRTVLKPISNRSSVDLPPSYTCYFSW